MTNEPLLHLSCLHVPCASVVDGTQLRICCKLCILYCSIRHHFVWPGLICCPGRALERKTNTQLLNGKVTGREIVWVHWALLLRNICAVLQDCADNQNEITRLEWRERIFKIFLYLSDSGCCTSTTNIYLWGFPFLTIISKIQTDQKNAWFKMRSILRVERKPLKNPRSFCQAYELQIADMLAQANP